MKYTDLSIQDRQDILRRVQSETGKDLQIIEKDWWVVAVLRALFELPYAQHISFNRVCGSGDVLIVVPDYASVWGRDLEEYQVHAKFVLLDTVTGYRSQELEYSTCLRATGGIPTDEP